MHACSPDADRAAPARSSSSTRVAARGSSALVFNHRRAVMLAVRRASPLLLGALAATKLTLNASFEKMIPRSHPYIQNYLEHRDELRGLGNALRIVVENPQRRHLRPEVPRRRCRRSTTSCSSRPASTAPG